MNTNTTIISLESNMVNGKFALRTNPPMTEALMDKMNELILRPPGTHRYWRAESCRLETRNGLILYDSPSPNESTITEIQELITLAEKALITMNIQYVAQRETQAKAKKHIEAQNQTRLDKETNVVMRALSKGNHNTQL